MEKNEDDLKKWEKMKTTSKKIKKIFSQFPLNLGAKPFLGLAQLSKIFVIIIQWCDNITSKPSLSLAF